MVKHNIILALIVLISLVQAVNAQEKCVYDDMSIDDLLNVNVIVTASKKLEDLFEAPLSVTIIKKEQIQQAGCTSIMEALRLAPGLIVREATPGNFDIHIRGFDDANKNFYVPIPFNSTILVMIDNRVVFSYFSGGTLWETLPVGIQNIERIEVVRGPASALYGPNAVNGVINIITSHAKESGLNTFANVGFGTQNSKNVNTSIGYNWNDNTKISLSTNFNERNRFDNSYYSWKNNQYVNQNHLELFEDILRDTINRINWVSKDFMDALQSKFDETLSLQTFNTTLYFSHNFGLQTKLDFSLGGSHSQSQKPGNMNFLTPMSQTKSQSFYFDSRITHYNWSGQINFIKGEDLSNFGFNSYSYNVFNALVEYNWQITPTINFRPGLDVRQVEYKSPITDANIYNFATLNNEYKTNSFRKVLNQAFYFLSEWRPTSSLRFIGGMRVDTFSLYQTASFNYEIACTYRINKDNLIRIVNSKASRAPFIFDTYLNATSQRDIYDSHINTYYPLKEFYISKNRLKYPTNLTLELGWRCKVTDDVDFDLELFGSRLTNLFESVNRLNFSVKYNDSLGIISSNGQSSLSAENLNTKEYQLGFSYNVNYKISEKAMLSFFGTIQKTFFSGNNDLYNILTDSSRTYDPKTKTYTLNMHLLSNITHWSPESTPNFYGGVVFNYKLHNSLNFNLNSYYYSRQVFVNNFSQDELYELIIDPWIDVNLKLSYSPGSKFNIYLSGNNLLGKHRELGGADNIGTTFLLGAQWGF